MRHYSRWQTAAILGVALFVSLAAMPNLLPATARASLPIWAQRTFELGYDLQGGTYVQFEVDRDDVRRQILEGARDTLRNVLRERRIGFTGLAIRSNGVEAVIRDPADMPRAIAALEELVRPLSVAAPANERRALLVRHVDGSLGVWASRNASPPSPELKLEIVERTVRLIADDAAYRRRAIQARDRMVRRLDEMTRPSVNDVPPLPISVSRVGADRVGIVVPGSTNPDSFARFVYIH